jgi:hypothetical protein
VTGVATGSTSAPSPADVRRIAALDDPIIRNLEITYCYSRLAAALAARSGEGANWCTYATWASRQAGRTIRGEDFLGELERRLAAGRWFVHPLRTLWRRLLRRGLFDRSTRLGRFTSQLHTPFDAFERASDAVARGNRKVFEEIGLEFARYLEAGSELQRFLGELRPGEPPDGQRYLRQAFARYEQLRHAGDPKTRAELGVLANLEIGLHEQTRLQPEIAEAIDAGLATNEDLGKRTLVALIPGAAQWWAVVRGPLAATVGAIAAGAQRTSTRIAREVISDRLMVLALPGRVLALGTHLADEYPDALREPALAELTDLLAQFEPTPPAHDDCGAHDWADFPQRMHYIVHLFRAFHLSADLSRSPFTPEQVARFERGTVPDGEL